MIVCFFPRRLLADVSCFSLLVSSCNSSFVLSLVPSFSLYSCFLSNCSLNSSFIVMLFFTVYPLFCMPMSCLCLIIVSFVLLLLSPSDVLFPSGAVCLLVCLLTCLLVRIRLRVFPLLATMTPPKTKDKGLTFSTILHGRRCLSLHLRCR